MQSRLNFRIDGDGDVVLLLHPVGLDLTSWDAVSAHLSATHKVVRVDLRGHGRSSAARPDATLSDYTQDVHDLIAGLGIGPVIAIGLSFGGMIAQTLAIDHPRDVSSLVICGCPATLPPSTRKVLAARGAAAAQGMQHIVEDTLTRWFTGPFIMAGKAEAVRERLLGDDPAGWITAWSAISALHTVDRLSEIRVPTLCIAGEFDVAAPTAAVEVIAAAVPGATMAVLPGAPHMMQIEMPELFSRTVARFFDNTRSIPQAKV